MCWIFEAVNLGLLHACERTCSCTCVRSLSLSLCVCVRVCVRACVRACVCVCPTAHCVFRARDSPRTWITRAAHGRGSMPHICNLVRLNPQDIKYWRFHVSLFRRLNQSINKSINQSMYSMSWGATGTQQTRSSVQ